MSDDNFERIVLENYENEFSFKKNKSNLNISFNRIAFIFFIFLFICSIYSMRVLYLSNLNSKISTVVSQPIKSNYRADIIDNSGNFLVKSVRTIDVGINPNLIMDKKKLIINLQLIFQNKDFSTIKKKIYKKKFFYLKKKISQEEYEKLRLLGEKSIIFEKKLSRIYPQENLFSHIIGQIDNENNGISGIEKFFDYELKTRKKPLELTVDTDIQFLIREELLRFQDIFKSKGSAAILMNVDNGNIISMVSIPDFNLNKRKEIKDIKFINRATKGVYELGSVFKTFTLAAAINEKEIEPNTEFKDLPNSIKCAGRSIREYDDKIPSDLTAEEILIRSGNIGSVRIAQKIGIEKFKYFLEKIGVLNKIEFDIEEVGEPISFRWGKCKLATSSFGHGITTTPLQLSKGYAIITNGGYDIRPTLIKNNIIKIKTKNKILNEGVSEKINPILRKIVSTKQGTAGFANIPGYQIGGKTGTAQKTLDGSYSKEKVNTFVGVFPTSKPKYVLTILLDEPKPNKDYIYHYRDGSGWKYKGTAYNTAGWTSVEVAGKIIEKIGPILATKYIKIN
tara:strand:- start:168 stop:1859 length:1692 start_codon:yes stop_codon:yes gene_type:complete